MSSSSSRKGNGDSSSSSSSSGDRERDRDSTVTTRRSSGQKSRSKLEAIVGSDRTAATFASQLSGVEWIGRTLGQLFTDSARVDASGEPPKGSEFNHIELEEIDVNLYRAKKEDLW